MRQCLAFAVVGLVLAILAVAAADAQNYAYVPDNNLSSGGSNSYPFSSSPLSWRYQMLHLAQYLPGKPGAHHRDGPGRQHLQPGPVPGVGFPRSGWPTPQPPA